ncbi:MAG: glycosyltransferase [Planctomycetota bacterium]
MKLLLCTPSYAPHFGGGTESVVRAQAGALAARGHAVTVISGTARPHAGADVIEERVDGIPVRFLPRHPGEKYSLLLERPRLRALIEALSAGADLAHVHHWFTLTGTLVRDLARRMPVVVTLHDFFSVCPRFFRIPPLPEIICPGPGEVEPCVLCAGPDAPGHPREALRAEMRRRIVEWPAELAAASALVLPSHAHAASLGALTTLPAARRRVIGHGLCTPVPCEDVALEWTGAGPLRVLVLGHLSEVKGVDDLVDAVASLPPAERGRVELLCLGEVVQPAYAEKLQSRARNVRLALLGGYEPAALPRRVREAGGAHLAALPSRAQETYGLVLDEAFALGLPTWVADRGAPPERVGAAGRVLPAADPPAWSRALSALLRAPDMLRAERAAVPRRGRTAADAAAELDDLYRALLASRP